eukprot:TRINITY_DN53_c0_g1_i5.p3 TRINITY_DN53_c0_g1~~TRINITY_DN53_c0_g1_i5.p3  ORF type:complete len:100 (-),score=11.48 TRINITY_DN53_c0_g1_i5:744-1043(-)
MAQFARPYCRRLLSRGDGHDDSGEAIAAASWFVVAVVGVAMWGCGDSETTGMELGDDEKRADRLMTKRREEMRARARRTDQKWRTKGSRQRYAKDDGKG